MISWIFSPGRMPVYDDLDVAAADQHLRQVDDARRRHAAARRSPRAAPRSTAAKHGVDRAGRASAGTASSPSVVIVTGPPLAICSRNSGTTDPRDAMTLP